jgi:thiol-disulfide isomerase/thioredoxin
MMRHSNLAIVIILVASGLTACAPPALAAAPELDSTQAPSAEQGETEILETIGRHKRCGSAPGLAGWLVRNRTVWSLENVLDGKQGDPAKGVIVSFFATWCEPCKKGLPILQQAQADAAAAGVPMILVAVPEFTMDVVPFLDAIGVKVPTIKDKFGGILKQWLLGRKEGKDSLSLPRTVLVNDTQQIARIYGMEGADFGALLAKDAKNVSKLCRPGEK